MKEKLNCWEAKSCGLEPGGRNVERLGVCPAAVDEAAEGANSGRAGGRICWAVPGTLCAEVEEGLGCEHCDFLDRVLDEEKIKPGRPKLMAAHECRRLFHALTAAALLWSLFALLGPRFMPELVGAPLIIVAGVVVASALALAVHLRLGRPRRGPVLWMAVTHAALQAAALAWIENVHLRPGLLSIQVSWICVLILSMPILLAMTRREAFIGPLIVAAMSPLVHTLGPVLGAEPPGSLAVLLSRFLPQFLCVAVATLPARMFGRLSAGAQRLGNYELVAKIGGGGMGEVWRAMHRMLARPAAIKLIRPETLERDPETVTNIFRHFEKEARSTALLGSPHTVEIYDFGVNDEGSFYYVMELLRGRDLQGLVEDHGPVPAARAIHFLRQACHSLGEAHEAGVIHRDVKPGNIFACRRGPDYDFVKVLDFGLVVELGHFEGDQRGISSGTPAYMAPEMQREDWRADPRVDIYGLGCVAYWLLTGEPAFAGDDFMAAVKKHAGDTPAPPSTKAPGAIPEELDWIVLACLSSDPEKRPGSVRDLSDWLSLCAKSVGEWSQPEARRWWEANLPQVKTPAAELLQRVSV